MKDVKAFSVFKKELTATQCVNYHGGFGLVTESGEMLGIITPCANIRSNNFILLARNEGLLGFYNVFLSEDQPAIFKDSDKRAEFMDLLRKKLAPFMTVLVTHSKAVTWDRVGYSIVARLAGSDVISFEPVTPEMLGEADSPSDIKIPYRGIIYSVKSRFAVDQPLMPFMCFAYSLVGNAYALLNNENS